VRPGAAPLLRRSSSEGGLPEPVWTGTELVVWSTTTDQAGRSTGNTASAYNPGTGRWRTLPPAPITPRRLAATVWAGDRLLVWGGIRNLRGDRLAYPGDGAAYDPRRDRWQRLARAPVPGRAWPLTAWTGDRVIFIGGANLGDRPRMDRGNLPDITEQGAAWRPR
jgi:N-acetylneuraminic acid mutarotase